MCLVDRRKVCLGRLPYDMADSENTYRCDAHAPNRTHVKPACRNRGGIRRNLSPQAQKREKVGVYGRDSGTAGSQAARACVYSESTAARVGPVR
jgi:hypothetical protein